MKTARGFIRKDIHFTENQIRLIEEEMKKTGTTFNEQVRRILDKYFEMKDNKGE